MRIASKLNYTVEEVLNMPLAKAMLINEALMVMEGKRLPTATISKEEQDIANFLSENKDELLKNIPLRGNR